MTRSLDVTVDERELERHRRELLALCYRMLGSVHDAEDVVQETMLRAWRSRASYDAGRASLRTWLYRIATNACLRAMQQRSRRPLPADLGPASHDPGAPLVPDDHVTWLQPLPDALVALDDPALQVERHTDLRLAVVAALQRLPARQRAAVILREALDWPAAEIADALGTTPAAVNSALQRARVTLGRSHLAAEGLEPGDPRCRRWVDAYVAAFERADVEAITRLVTADVILEMPPVPLWFAGRTDYGRFMADVFARRPGRWRLVVASANHQPALVAYSPGPAGVPELHSYQVLDVTADGLRRHTVFYDAELMARLGLPARPASAA